MNKKDQIVVYTDGSVHPNPGFGGWAYHVPSLNVSGVGGASCTTNNRMEMLAVIHALKYLRSNGYHSIKVLTDSNYVVVGVTDRIPKWQARKWRSVVTGGIVKNKDLWMVLADYVAELNVELEWVRGHNGNELNEKVDLLANAARVAYVASVC